MSIATFNHPNALCRISHELRTPLTGIMGMVHFLNATPLNSEQKNYLDAILKSANQLLGLEDSLKEMLNQGNA